MIFGILTKGGAGKASDRKVETWRAKLTFVISIRGKIDDFVWFALKYILNDLINLSILLAGLSSTPSKLSTFLAVLLSSKGNVAFSWQLTAKEMLVKGMLCFFHLNIYNAYDNRSTKARKTSL